MNKSQSIGVRTFYIDKWIG